jgi:hypothetical protein
MAEFTSSLVVLLLDQDSILVQIRSAAERLLKNPTKLRWPYSAETFKSLDGLYREVMKLAKTGLVPDLGQRLFALYQELDISANCSALLAEEWLSIEDDDHRTKDFLNAMTYLKLSAFCGYDESRYVWADLAKKVKHERLPYKALEDLNLIRLHNEAHDIVDITTCHEFVGHSMRLICEVLCEEPQYKLYMALQEAHIQWAQTCGSGYDGNVNTTEMVQFLIEQLEGTN